MELQRVSSNRLHKATDIQQTLKAGDITKGKILKLYPNQKAAIQLGNQTMVAQLEAPLTTNASYYFQVQHTSSDVIHLKVLHDQSQHTEPDNPRSLLNYLGLKTTKSRLSLLAMLIKEKIPFGKAQLRDAFELIDKVSDKAKGQSIIKEMILRNLPLSEDTWKALSAHANSTISAEAREMMHVLNEKQASGTTKNLQHILGRLLLKPQRTESLLVNEITSELKQGRSSFYNILKAFGAIEGVTDLSSWETFWAKRDNAHSGDIETGRFPTFPKEMKHVSTILENLHQANSKQTNIRQEAQTILHHWSSPIHQALIHQKELDTHSLNAFNEVTQDKLTPFLANEQLEGLQALLSKNNASAMRDILNMLQVMSKEQTYHQVEHFLTLVKTEATLFSLSPKEQFMQQINQLFAVGVGAGKSIPQVDTEKQSQTIKSLLTQLLHNSEGVVHDKSNQLIHFLNGLQLQSVHETANFLEASIQIPAERLGLHGDISVDVSGQKNESGEINPNYCHILFYLDLATIRETVIDMQIQKRVVHLTILNAYKSELQHVNKTLQDALKQGLEALDYDLQTVQFKLYPSMKKQEKREKTNMYSPIHQGVDYRI